MPGNVDEKDWEKAKKLASEQGKEDIYPYVMGIYNRIHEHTCGCNHLEESSDWEEIFFNSAIEYGKKKLGIKSKVKLKHKKSTKKVFGHIDLLSNDNTIVFDKELSTKLAIENIYHELVHIKQKKKKELSYSDGFLIFNGQKYDLNEYNNTSDYNFHSKFPWEKEANKKSVILQKQFFKSKEFQDLKGINSNLDFVISLQEDEGTTISSDFGDNNRPENVLSVARIGLHNRPKPKSKKVDVGNMFDPTPKYERYFEEDDWGNDTVTPSKFVEQVLDEEALKEFNIQQWSKHISAFTNKHKKIRKKTIGDEKRVAKLVDYYFGRNIVVMKTVPTFFVPNKGYDNKNNKWKSYTKYPVMIEFTNINEYLKKAREKSGRTINVWNLSETTFRRLIKASNIKVDCGCGSYWWQGKMYRATQVNSSIYPQTIADPVWRSVHGSSDYLCKHLASIIPLIEKSAGKILKLIQKKKLEGRSPAPIKAKRK